MLKTLQDVLFPVGTIVEAVEPPNDENETEIYLIIGKRVLNIGTKNVWDYIGVPYETGFKLTGQKESIADTNFYYFNHTDIVSIKSNLII